jgi:GAF domain-containing protein
MYRADKLNSLNKQEYYQELNSLLTGLMDPQAGLIANLANACALLGDQMEDINWAGFYLLNEGQLILGPFQGKPACTLIPLGKGVCGTAAQARQIQVVPDVHLFPGHIACDSASRSEIVLPLVKEGKLIGVLDIDSPSLARFDGDDAQGLSRFVEILLENIPV